MYDNGEAGADGITVFLTDEEYSFSALQLAKKYHGIALIWEHRFYGQSLPFSVNSTTGLADAGYDAYKYLNNEQALEDAVYFAKHFSPPGYSEEQSVSLRADSTPWIWIGGSYPGIRAAIIRQRNPDVFFASWASSAPVHTVIGAPVYYNPIQQTLATNCSADIHAAVTYADDILSHGSADEVALVRKALFLTNTLNPSNRYTDIPTPDKLSYWDLSEIISYPFQGSIVAFQSFGPRLTIIPFCANLESWNAASFPGFNESSSVGAIANNPDNSIPTAAGIAATHGNKAAFYAYLYAITQKYITDAPFGDPQSPVDAASWIWQLCTQFGQWQVTQAYTNPNINLISKFYNVSGTEANFCHSKFPYAPAYPEIREILKYGGWAMQPSNIMWTNGEIDPMRTLGVQSITKINPHALNRPSTTTVPSCGVPPNGQTVFGQVYTGAVHAQDLALSVSGPAPVEAGLELFGNALDAWLPCFKSKH